MGFKITKLNNNLEQEWSMNDLPESPNNYTKYVDLINNEESLVIWKDSGLDNIETSSSTSIDVGIENINSGLGNVQKTSVAGFKITDGEKIFERVAYDNSGTILYNQRLKTGNNDGIYFLKIGSSGKEMAYTKIPNKEIQPTLKSFRKKWAIGEKDKIFIQNLVVTDDGIVLIAEMFSKNFNLVPGPVQAVRGLVTGSQLGRNSADFPNGSNSKKVVFKIKDFVLFSFSDLGNLTKIETIAKKNIKRLQFGKNMVKKEI